MTEWEWCVVVCQYCQCEAASEIRQARPSNTQKYAISYQKYFQFYFFFRFLPGNLGLNFLERPSSSSLIKYFFISPDVSLESCKYSNLAQPGRSYRSCSGAEYLQTKPCKILDAALVVLGCPTRLSVAVLAGTGQELARAEWRCSNVVIFWPIKLGQFQQRGLQPRPLQLNCRLGRTELRISRTLHFSSLMMRRVEWGPNPLQHNQLWCWQSSHSNIQHFRVATIAWPTPQSVWLSDQQK